MATQFETESFSVGSGFSWITTTEHNGMIYYDGNVITPHGIVSVYSQMDLTSMTFVWNGKQYRRTCRRRFGPRSLSKFAKAFAKEIASAKTQPGA